MKRSQEQILRDLRKVWAKHPNIPFGMLIHVISGSGTKLLDKSDEEILKDIRNVL